MTQRFPRMDRFLANSRGIRFAASRARLSRHALAAGAAATAVCVAVPAVAPAAVVVQDAGAVFTQAANTTGSYGITVSPNADVLVAVAEWRANGFAPGFSYAGGSSTSSTFQTLWGTSADSTNNNVAISYLYNPNPGSYDLSDADFNAGAPATVEYFTLSGVDTSVAATYNAVNSGAVNLNTTSTNSGFTTPANNTTVQSLDFGTVTAGQFAVLVSQANASNTAVTLAGSTNNGTLETSFGGQIGSGNYFESNAGSNYGLNGVMLDLASSAGDMTLTETESATNSDKWTTAGFVFTPLGTPEPASIALLGLGAATLLLSRRRRRQA